MAGVWITVFGFAFIFLATTLGASVVFFFKKEISYKWNSFIFGLASGVMMAASVWSLLLPSIEQAKNYFGGLAFLPAVLGIVFGGAFIVVLDRLALKKVNNGRLQKSAKLFLAVTLHNIPEGLAVGFAFGAVAGLKSLSAYISALGLAIGIGVQNFPEGVAVALPMKKALNSRRRAFLWGMISGLPEPFFAVLGYFLATWLRVLQPWLLAFSAGAMLFVSADDLIPDSKQGRGVSIGAWGVLIGFALMMALDVALGA